MKDYGKNPNIFRKWLRNYKVARHRPKIWRLPSPDIAYVKITKVASTSIELTLARHLHVTVNGGLMEDVDAALVKSYSDQYAQHLTLAEFGKNARPPCVISFVRNPLDRLHSSYMDKISDVKTSGGGKNIFWNLDISLDMSFDEFVARVAEIPDGKIDRHLRSQSAFLWDGEKVIADIVGKFETISDDWKKISEQYGLPDLPHKNKSTKSTTAKSQIPYTLASAKMAAERYKQDIELFSYGDEIDALISSLSE
jgi:hypothetical protein